MMRPHEFVENFSVASLVVGMIWTLTTGDWVHWFAILVTIALLSWFERRLR